MLNTYVKKENREIVEEMNECFQMLHFTSVKRKIGIRNKYQRFLRCQSMRTPFSVKTSITINWFGSDKNYIRSN